MVPGEMSLLGVLIDCFEKNEILWGWSMRQLPLPDPQTAARKYREFRDELVRWKGEPSAEESGEGWQRADWGDIRMKQAGRGLMLWARNERVYEWWHERATWEGDPMAEAWHRDPTPDRG